MKRDWRLLLTAALIVISIGLYWFNYLSTIEWFMAYGSEKWPDSAQQKSIDCKYDCSPPSDLILYALALSLTCLVLIILAWWKPKK